MKRWLRKLRNGWSGLRCRWSGHQWERTQVDWRESMARFGPLGVMLGDGLVCRRCRRCGMLEGRMK